MIRDNFSNFYFITVGGSYSPMNTLYLCSLIYFFSFLCGVLLLQYLHYHTIMNTFFVDVFCTFIVFLFSTYYKNSSIYDPYWSAIPIIIVLYWIKVINLRSILSCSLVFLWGFRLTYNCFRRWPTLTHEDFRYQDIQKVTGIFYPVVNFLGIHLYPTIEVFLGCLPLYFALTIDKEMNILDWIGTVVTFIAISIEWIADDQLWTYLHTPNREEILKTGIWKYSRHPNYFGEILFWWGIGFFGISIGFEYYWTLIGAILINLMFVFISIPLMDNRSLKKRVTYREHMRNTNDLVPLPLF